MPVTTIDTTTALVLVDLQNLVVGLPTTPYAGSEVVARAVEPADAFHHHGAPVVLVRLTARADGSDAAPGRTEIPRPPGPLPAGWDDIVDDLTGHLGDIIVTKLVAFAYGCNLGAGQLERLGAVPGGLAGLERGPALFVDEKAGVVRVARVHGRGHVLDAGLQLRSELRGRGGQADLGAVGGQVRLAVLPAQRLGLPVGVGL
ncbi:isochorismatase family protein [Nonomuraea sp. MG754425]|uniref:isochorismatase family protein n=1 Tax=Nonomuraea sp. MG754425 TaxID=2570319 RepID=UPI002A05B20B|nr:isochorismatase family protein [Nonomuraea sp. MG754425]